MRRLLTALIAAALIAVGTPVAASDDIPIYAYARKLANGKVEVAFQVGNNPAQFPRVRMFPYPTVRANRPLTTSTVTANHPTEGPIQMSVTVNKRPNGNVWVTPRSNDPDIAVLLIAGNEFPYRTARVGEWWRSESADLFSQRDDTEPRAPQSWFPPPGQCGGNPDIPGSVAVIAICTPPSGAATVEEHLDEFLAMWRPHWPWIGAALVWSGGYTISHTLCDSEAAGCYHPDDRRAVIAADALHTAPMWYVEQVLIHELAHAFDYMASGSGGLSGRLSATYMTRYPEELRAELFADALTALVLDDRTYLPYYDDAHHSFSRYWDDHRDYFGFESRADFDAMLEQVPERPAMLDRILVEWAVASWCNDHDISYADCIGPTEVVWPDGTTPTPTPRWPSLSEILEGLPRTPNINATIDFGCLDELLDDPDRIEC